MSGLFNPLSFLALPVLILISLPLAGFAAFTTIVAVSTLFVRASVVYFELGLALLRNCLFGREVASRKLSTSKFPRRRRSSTLSTSSSGFLADSGLYRHAAKSDSYASLLGPGMPNRDYEGVGGWRTLGDEPEEELWINMNSRLELPAAAGPSGGRRHRRSLTGGSQRTWAPESMRMSPMESRARTPTPSLGGREDDGGYFVFHSHGSRKKGSGPASVGDKSTTTKASRWKSGSSESVESIQAESLKISDRP